MFAYPTQLPTEELMLLVNKLRGKDTTSDLATLVQAGWTVIGYGLSQLPHDTPYVVGTAQVTEAQLADKLESLSVGAKQGVALPWNVLLPVLVNFLQTLLANRGK